MTEIVIGLAIIAHAWLINRLYNRLDFAQGHIRVLLDRVAELEVDSKVQDSELRTVLSSHAYRIARLEMK